MTSRASADPDDGQQIERATVFVPEGKVSHFLTRFGDYAKTAPKAKGERRHEDMLDRVADLQLATLRSLWTDATIAYPADDEKIWWEVWLRRHDGKELQRITEFADHQKLTISDRRLQFDQRIVVLLLATSKQLAGSIDVLNDVAELQRAKVSAEPFVNMKSSDQGEWVDELKQRTRPAPPNSPVVCILDTGVNRGHPLLSESLDEDDCHAYDPRWKTSDHHGHGTELAGLALFGDLAEVLHSSEPVHLRHRLESVKVLPPSGKNDPEIYGRIAAEAANRVESHAPERSRCYAMAIAATDDRDRGQPTSWSSAIDAVAAGRSFDQDEQGLVYLDDDPERRLFLLCAGNVDPTALSDDHLAVSDSDGIHDPGQAWNALTIGAYTEKALITHEAWDGFEAVAESGDLSPWSTTGLVFADAWPIKPDVVFEGGNTVKNAQGEVDFPCEDLCLLTTSSELTVSQLALSWATSAATVQAARMVAAISAEYPDFWPETLRALVVNSARWTRRMQEHLKGAGGKRARARLARRYGFGVPQLARALRSAGDALTLIAQDSIRPFEDKKMCEIHFFELPWPRDALQGLGETPVQMRVSLSYFVEPNPGRRGWKNRHRYQSHGLRFDVIGPDESPEEFRKRLNERARAEDDDSASTGGDPAEWYLGEQSRSRGSIHTDILSTFGAALAERNVIGVYPVSGWWKDDKKRDRSSKGARYSLVVTLETPSADVDIWTPVAQQVGVPIQVES